MFGFERRMSDKWYYVIKIPQFETNDQLFMVIVKSEVVVTILCSWVFAGYDCPLPQSTGRDLLLMVPAEGLPPPREDAPEFFPSPPPPPPRKHRCYD